MIHQKLMSGSAIYAKFRTNVKMIVTIMIHQKLMSGNIAYVNFIYQNSMLGIRISVNFGQDNTDNNDSSEVDVR